MPHLKKVINKKAPTEKFEIIMLVQNVVRVGQTGHSTCEIYLYALTLDILHLARLEIKELFTYHLKFNIYGNSKLW